MKTFKELNKQFEKEDNVWKLKMEILVKKHSELMKDVNELPLEEFFKRIDEATEVVRRMSELSTLHNKFLLKWQRKLQRKCMIDFLKKIFQIKKAET